MNLTNERLKEFINEDNHYIPILRQMASELLQLRALRDAGDDEVDAILQSDQSSEACEEALADIARRAIASRDEVVGLLKWVATSKVDGLSVMATLMAKSHYGNTDARRILEIVEGK